MGRHTGGTSYDHWVCADGCDYAIGWTVDFYYASSRLRFPRGFTRWTNEAGARRFCKKWGLTMPATRSQQERHDG